MVVRSLLTLLGFKSDTKQLNTYKNALNGIVKATKLAAVATVALGTAAFKTAGDMEQVEIAFETMLGSAEKADKLIKEITQFAATTPFELKGLVDSSKQLLAFGIGAEDIITKMNVLGNISAGVGRDKLPTLVRSFGKIRTKGRATMEELNMMLEAGVPILDELAKNLGVTQEELFKMISKGLVSFSEVDAALTGLATGSGKFANLMEKQSKSFLGIISNIGDFIYNLTAAIGKELLPTGKELAKLFLDFLETNKEIIKAGAVVFFKSVVNGIKNVILFIKNIIDEMGGLEKVLNIIKSVVKNTFKSIMPIAKVFIGILIGIFKFIDVIVDAFGGWEKVLSFLIPTIIGLIAGIKILSAVMAVANAIMAANPIVLIILAVLALIVALAVLIKNWDKVAAFLKKTWSRFVKWWNNLWKGVIEFFKGTWDGITDFFSGIWEKFLEILVGVIRLFVKAFMLFQGFWENIWNKIKQFFIDVWNSFTDKVSEVWGKTKEIILSVWNSIAEGIKGVWKNVVGFVTGLWQGVLDFIEGVKNFGAGVKNFFSGIFGGGDKEPTGAPPPGAVTTTVGGNTNSMSIKEVNIGVPAGTPVEQKQYIQQNVEKAIRTSFDSYLREGLVNNPVGG